MLLIIFGVLLILLLIVLNINQPPYVDKYQDLFNLVNNVRISKHVAPLKASKQLDQIAQEKAQDMCTRNYWSHDDPNGRSWTYFYNNYLYQKAGENLAKGFTDNNTLVTAWVNSPEHYANIIDSNFKYSGIDEVICPSYQGRINVKIVAQEFTNQ